MNVTLPSETIPLDCTSTQIARQYSRFATNVTYLKLSTRVGYTKNLSHDSGVKLYNLHDQFSYMVTWRLLNLNATIELAVSIYLRLHYHFRSLSQALRNLRFIRYWHVGSVWLYSLETTEVKYRTRTLWFIPVNLVIIDSEGGLFDTKLSSKLISNKDELRIIHWLTIFTTMEDIFVR